MKLISVTAILLLTLLLVGCDSSSNDPSVTGSDFFRGTVITEYYVDAEFTSGEIDESYFESSGNDTQFTIVTDHNLLSNGMDSYSHLSIEQSDISEITDCNNEHCTYLLIPMYSEGDFVELSRGYIYNEGNLCIYAGPSPLNENQKTIKIVVLKIDSEYAYTVTNDMSVCPYYK